MKKVMIGILILIPVLILLIVAAVSNIVYASAWIAVDDFNIYEKETKNIAESLVLELSDASNTLCFKDFFDIDVMPERANRYTIEWRISDDIECLDEEYDASYKLYLQKLEAHNAYLLKIDEINTAIERLRLDESIPTAERRERIKALEDEKAALKEPEVSFMKAPAAMVDDSGNEVESNTSGKFRVGSFCRFTVVVQAENISKSFVVSVVGYDVKIVTIVNLPEQDTNVIRVGESKRVEAKYEPVDSIVTATRWESSDTSVAVVDDNGVITGVGVGEADITVGAANKPTEDDDYVSCSVAYRIKVEASLIGSKFGKEVTVSKDSVTLDEIGLKSYDIISVAGGAKDGNIITVSGDQAVVTTVNGKFTINKCAPQAIKIANSELFNAEGGFVFAVSGVPLMLHVQWADDLAVGTPDGVIWSSSNDEIATVEDGIVTAVASGKVVITASRNGQIATLELDTRVKVTSLQLRNSKENLAIGLARETVFATYKYVNITDGNMMEVNNILMTIVGEPTRYTNESDESYAQRLAEFYDCYKFEIENGEDCAYFATDAHSDVPADKRQANRLVLIPTAFRSGKKSIVVKVSAKYPKYDSVEISASVTLNIVYGVEVSNIKEFRAAAAEQKEYAFASDNVVLPELTFDLTNTENGRNDRYRLYSGTGSKYQFSIVFTDNVEYEPDIQEIDGDMDVNIYGSLYGNNKMLSAGYRQLHKRNGQLINICLSNITVSNLRMRANAITEDGVISSDETKMFTGRCIGTREADFEGSSADKHHLENLRLEYCIAENGRQIIGIDNCDITLDGVIMRNVNTIAMYVPTRMHTYKADEEEDGVRTTYPFYSHLTTNNCVFSNCIGSIASLAYERFTVMPKKGNEADFDDYQVNDGRFVRYQHIDKKENAALYEAKYAENVAYFREHFISKGINTVFNQKGFLDIYNWQDLDNAHIIEIEDGGYYNDVIATLVGPMIKTNRAFKDYKYTGTENKEYIHMGFFSAGLSMGEGIIDEPVYLQFNNEDKRIGRIATQALRKQGDGNDVTVSILNGLSMELFCYKNDAKITPYSTYEINLALIGKLHS